MNRKFVVNEQTKRVVQEVLDMLEMDDGKSFEVKKADILKILDDKLAAYENERKEKRSIYHALKNER